MPRTTRSAPPLPLGSLTQRGARRGHCDACDSDRVTEISMTLADGSSVEFVHCLNCEVQGWRTAGGSLTRDRVLAKATTRK